MTSLSARASVDPTALTLPKARKITLENGLRLLVTEHEGSGVVSFYGVVNVGSATEAPFIGSGISHYLEHMLFKGTQQLNEAGAIDREVAELGGYNNGYTNHDQTAFVITVPKEQAERAAGLMIDMLLHPLFDPAEIEKEREVIRNEMRRGEDEPARRLHEMLWNTAYREHTYRHPVIGYRELFDRITREDLLRFHQRYYVPSNMVLSVAGDVRQDDVRAWVQARFDHEPAGAAELYTPTAEPVQLAPRRRVEFHDSEIARVSLAYPSVDLTDPELYALDVLAAALGQGESSVLVEELQYEKQLVHSIYAANVTPRWPGLWTIGFSAAPDQVERTLDEIESVIRRVQSNGLPEERLARARQQLLGEYLFQAETDEGLARRAAEGELLAGDPNFDDIYLDGFLRVTSDDVRRAAQRYLRLERRTVAVLGPQPAHAQPSAGAGGAVEGTTSAVRVDSRRLPNGVTLLSRQDPKLPILSLRVVCKGGLWGEADRPGGVMTLMARLLTRGTASRSAAEIARLVEGWGGELDTFSGNNSVGISLDVPSLHGEAAVRLLHELLTAPAFDEAEFEAERARQLASIHASEDSVFFVAQRQLRQALYDGHPYGRMAIGSLDSVAAIQRADVLACADDWLRPEWTVVSAFGQVSDPVFETVEKVFGSWKPSGGAESTPPKSAFAQLPSQERVSRDQEQAVVMLGFPGVGYADPDKPALDVLTDLLSGSDGRLYSNIREQQGLAYALGADAMYGYDTGHLVVYAATSPTDADRVAALLQQELARCVEERVPDEELARVKRQMRGLHRIGLQSNGAKALQASLDELYGVGASYMEQYPDIIEAVTADEVQRVAQRYFQQDRAAVIVLGPWSPSQTSSSNE